MRSSNASAAATPVSVAATPLQVRGRFFTAAMVPVQGTPDGRFLEALDAALAQSPSFFANAPLVLDIGQADGLDTEAAFEGLISQLRARNLTPLGVQNATQRQSQAAGKLGLTMLKGGGDTPPKTRAHPVAAPAEEPTPTTLVVTQPVRSGQLIHAEHGDLVVVAPVGSGAELIARGNIHVYGRLRGRALAGVYGDRSARIFCQRLDAELIAIAGLYMTNDGFGAAVAGQNVQAFLEGDALHIEAL